MEVPPESLQQSARALLVFADPALHRSRLGRRLSELTAALDAVQMRDLYELYPDFFIDVNAERDLVQNADLVVFIFQLRSYTMPSLLVEWIDVVLQGGRHPTRRCWAIVACAGSHEEYRQGGRHGRELRDYLRGLEQTTVDCGMAWTEPHAYYGADLASASDIDAHSLKLLSMLAKALHDAPVSGASDGT